MNSVDAAVNALKQMIGTDPACVKYIPAVFPLENGDDIIKSLPDDSREHYKTIWGILKQTHEMAFMAGKTMGLAKM